MRPKHARRPDRPAEARICNWSTTVESTAMPIPGLPYTDEQLFPLINGALPAWLLLLVAPRWRGTLPIVTATALVFAALYVLVLANTILTGEGGDIDMFTYQGVAKLLATPSAVLPAWVHYVVFDLWAARWQAVDALGRGVPQVLMALPLFFTCMLGPTGLLIYIVLIRPFFSEKPAAAKRD